MGLASLGLTLSDYPLGGDVEMGNKRSPVEAVESKALSRRREGGRVEGVPSVLGKSRPCFVGLLGTLPFLVCLGMGGGEGSFLFLFLLGGGALLRGLVFLGVVMVKVIFLLGSQRRK